MLRFREARGRYYEDPASDSSWTPHETKDLDQNAGSHIKPGRLRNAVVAGAIKDVDNYFRAAEAEDLTVVMTKRMLTISAELRGRTGELQSYRMSLKGETDKAKIADIQVKVDNLAGIITGLNKDAAELRAKMDEIEKAREADDKLKADAEEKARLEAEEAAALAAQVAADAEKARALEEQKTVEAALAEDLQAQEEAERLKADAEEKAEAAATADPAPSPTLPEAPEALPGAPVEANDASQQA